jgi:hypothetical protein
VFWVVWAFLFRGGYGFWRGGIVLRRADGRKPARWQCAYRAALVWGPVVGLLDLAVGLTLLWPGLPWLYFGTWGAGVCVLLVWVGLALWSPTQGVHDRLAGTCLIPGPFTAINLVAVLLGLFIPFALLAAILETVSRTAP